ncbi:MAG: phasin family protein [Hyphomonadaceae bacterium]
MTAKRTNGAGAAPESMPAFLTMMQGPASFMMSQRIALEAARFWARRMRAYADQMETLASCSSPEDIASAQTHFFERLREDYAEETQTMRSLMTPQAQGEGRDAET